MARKNFLRPLYALVVFGAVPVVAACGGRVISLGSSDTLKTVAADTISGTPNACPSGFVHPNICCSGTGSSATCGAWEANPLRACDPGDTTYPDPLSCCSLTDPKTCIDTPQDAGVVPVPPPPFGCGYVCPPGWWEETPTLSNGTTQTVESECCTQQGGFTACVPQAPVEGNNGFAGGPVTCATGSSGGGSSTGTGPNGGVALDAGAPTDASVDAGPAPDGGPVPPADGGTGTVDGGTVDGGTVDGGVWTDDGGCTTYDAGYPIDNYDGGAASLCYACPPGWNAPSTQPELCCQSGPDGTEQCFSQATGSAFGIGSSTAPSNGGSSSTGSSSGSSGTTTPPSSGWGGGSPNGPTCSGTDTSCSCEQTLNGHTYALDCYVGASGVPSCTCSVDGTSAGTATVSSCQDSTSVEGAFSATSGCAFP